MPREAPHNNMKIAIIKRKQRESIVSPCSANSIKKNQAPLFTEIYAFREDESPALTPTL
jgi:hypothetical protein